MAPAQGVGAVIPREAPTSNAKLADYAFAIDGSYAEVDVRNGYPGAKVGYVTVASVLIDLKRIGELDEDRPVDPREFRKTEEASTLDAAIPGCNVVTRTHTSAAESFREAVYENFFDAVVDSEGGGSLLETYEFLLSQRSSPTGCPYKDRASCESFVMPAGVSSCPCSKAYPIYSTDALRIQERFHDSGTNGEAFGEVMQVWERVLLIHLLRWFERRGLLEQIARVVFILDGPLATFGHPAWLSPLIKAELKRLNAVVRAKAGSDLKIIGVEKTGAFVTHFEELDQTATGEPFFPNRTYALLTDKYIKERVIFSDSDKPYGKDTYFGRKFLYKAKSGARVVGTMAILDDTQDDITADDISKYPAFASICAILDKVVSSRFPNSVGPIITAHSHAAIPLTLGTKVLEQLARALVKGS
jgi:NurA domain-containing protein